MRAMRWAVVVTAASLVVAVAAVAYAAGKARAAPVAEAVRAKRFEVIGKTGKPYAVISALETVAGVSVSLLDQEGEIRGSLGFGNARNAPVPSGPVYLGISGRGGPTAGYLLLGVTEKGDPEVVTIDRVGRWPLFLQVGEDGELALAMTEKSGNRRTVVSGGSLRILKLGAEGPEVLWQAP